MSVVELMESLDRQGVELWYEGDRLRFRAPKGALTAEQRAELSARRAEVVAQLRVEAASKERTCPLSFSQRSLWFLHQQAPESTAYHIAMSLRVRCVIDAGALRQALQGLVDRHAILRTTYDFIGGMPTQLIAGAVGASMELHAVSGVGETELRSLVEADYRRPFDLQRGSVFRTSLYTRGLEDHVLLLTVHHIAADGWSLLLLFEEFLKLYAEATGGPAAGLARSDVQYTNYSSWQEQTLAGPEGDRLWEYWREKLAPPRTLLHLPTDRPRPAIQTFCGASVPLHFGAGQTERLKQLARQEGTTLFVVLLATFQALLFRLNGSGDVIVGTPAFGRNKAEFARVVGDFVNALPVRGRLSAAMSFRELIAQLRQTVLEALDAQEYPLPLLVQRLQPERDASRSPLFDTFFVLQHFDQFRELEKLLVAAESDAAVEIGGLRLAAYPLRQQEGQFDIGLRMAERGGDLQGVFNYSTELFGANTVSRFAAGYLALVETLARDPDTALGELPKPDLGATTGHEDVVTLLHRLKQRDVRVFLDGDRLRVNAPKGVLDEALKAEIAARRDELSNALRTEGTFSEPSSTRTRVSIRPIPRDGGLPLSSAQQRLWFLDRVEPGRSHYNVGGAARFRGFLDPDILGRAFDELVRRHESLRMRFTDVDGVPCVEILEPAGGALEVRDLSHLPAVARLAEARRLSEERLRMPFDLARGPLARYFLACLAPDEHQLTVCMHHIASDGWSLVIATREICQIYDALAAGRAPALVPLSVQYVDYAAWERQQLHSGLMAGHLRYWKQQLAGAPRVLELPTDRPRPATQSFRGRRLRHFFDLRLLDALKSFSRQHEVTLFMTLLAAWQVLLHRYSGQDDIVVGSPIANRDLPALERLIGCFVNNVVLRGRLTGNPSFTEFLAQVKQTTLGAFDHRDLPFDVLVEGLHPERNASHAPVFQVLFALQSFPTDFTAPAGLNVQLLEPQMGTARFDLALEVAEYDDKFEATYEYARDLFDAQSIDRMHTHLERLLTAITHDPGCRVQSLPVLTSDDERVLLDVWNDTAVDLDRSRCVHHLLEASARTAPEATAVTAGDTALSYRDLDERANRLAHLLMARGVAPGALVAICVDRTVEMAVALAAVLKAGAAYVPLDPTHPAERLQYTLGDAGVACAITLARFAPLLAQAEALLVLLDEVELELAALPASPVAVATRPEDLAYVIYTSGSTGRPKGVQVEHRNVVSFLEAMRREPGFTDRDVLLAVTTLSFDIAGLEFWLPFSVGGRVVIASRTDVLDGERLMALLQEHRVTVMQATPATWRMMLEAGWTGKADLKVLCGGEALPRDLAATLTDRVAKLWNMYGPTETTIWSTVGRVEDVAGAIPIGRPIVNTKVYVLEPSGLLAPIGVPGELCIGGEGVARGYRNRPELTAEKFVTITLPGGRAERVYRTGDVARFRGDGQLEFIGRRDHQVKVRGYRIELGEIEAILATHPGVKECVVTVREDTPGDQRLVGYVVTTAGSSFDPDAARTTLRAKLPDYMIPNSFMILPALPLTPNGKIDRKMLPAPEAPPPRAADVADTLMTPAQLRVAGIWQDVLHVDRVGLYDNFFDLGGHSLLLVKLHAALKREFSGDLELVELFQRTTVAAQADRLSSAAAADGALRRAQARAARQMHG